MNEQQRKTLSDYLDGTQETLNAHHLPPAEKMQQITELVKFYYQLYPNVTKR